MLSILVLNCILSTVRKNSWDKKRQSCIAECSKIPITHVHSKKARKRNIQENLGNLLLSIFPKHTPQTFWCFLLHVCTHIYQLPTETGPQLLLAKWEPGMGRRLSQKQGHVAGQSRRFSWHLMAASAGPALGQRRCAHCCQLCPTLSDPMRCSPPGSPVQGILQARILERAVISSSRGSLLTQGSNLRLLPWQADSLPLSHMGSSQCRQEDSTDPGLVAIHTHHAHPAPKFG